MQAEYDLLMSSPGRNELALRDRLLGKNTLQAVKIILEEFVRRFGNKYGEAKSLEKIFLPGGRAISWGDLDGRICMFCKSYIETFGTIEINANGTVQCIENFQSIIRPQINYFESIRYVLRSLPQINDYNIPEHKMEFKSPEEVALNFDRCFLCWRSVPRKPYERKTPLCHVHKGLSSTDKEYRRRKRMRTLMLTTKEQLRYGELTSDRFNQIAHANMQSFFGGLRIISSRIFPMLTQHIISTKIPITTCESLIKAIEHPLSFNGLSDMMQEAWQFHFEDRAAYFENNYDWLLTMEAWLQAEAQYKHGGIRHSPKTEQNEDTLPELEKLSLIK